MASEFDSKELGIIYLRNQLCSKLNILNLNEAPKMMQSKSFKLKY